MKQLPSTNYISVAVAGGHRGTNKPQPWSLLTTMIEMGHWAKSIAYSMSFKAYSVPISNAHLTSDVMEQLNWSH
jgi:hypothetical protein